MSINVSSGSHGPVDWAIHTVAGATSFDHVTAHVPLLRRRIQVVCEAMGGGATFSVLVRPVGSSSFVAWSGPHTTGQWSWIHAGGSAGGVLVDAVRVTFSAGGGRVILASTPEGL